EVPAPTFILAGLGAVWLWEQIRLLVRADFHPHPNPPPRSGRGDRTPLLPLNGGRGWGMGVTAALALLALFTLWVNFHVYFGELGNDARLWDKNQALSTDLGSALADSLQNGQIPAGTTVYAPDWLITQRDDRDVLALTANGKYKFASLDKAPDHLDGPVVFARPNLTGYWQTIAEQMHTNPPILQRSAETDKQTQGQIDKLVAGRPVQQITGSPFPLSNRPAFWIYIVR
ncbi:MAG: hypothetical protein WCF84_13860, partial [Anaerolineae bacterium]